MIVEKRVIDAVNSVTGVLTFFGVQPQGPDDQPSPLPVVIVNRTGTRWANEFGGADTGLAITQIQVDVYAETAEGCRRIADLARTAIRDLADDDGNRICPTLDSEVSFYDQESRGWRIMQVWTPPEYEPVLPP